jgi:hypothetical protein
MSSKKGGYSPPPNMKGSGTTPTPKVPAAPRIYTQVHPPNEKK